MSSCKLLAFYLSLTLVVASLSESYCQTFWLESRSGYSFRNNDFYVDYLNDYHLLTSESRIGMLFMLQQPGLYVQPYFCISAIHDAGSDNWNEVDWHNNFVYGVGARLRYHPGKFLFLRPRDFSLSFFAEVLGITYQKNDLFYTGHRPTNDMKAGAEYWLSFRPDPTDSSFAFYFWMDNAGSISYAKSSFYSKLQTDYILLNAHSLFGIGYRFSDMIQAQIFVSGEASTDLGHKDREALDWYNKVEGGFGSRFFISRFHKSMPGQLNIVVMPFIELLWTKYLRKVYYVPTYRPTSDIAFGVTVWLTLNFYDE